MYGFMNLNINKTLLKAAMQPIQKNLPGGAMPEGYAHESEKDIF